MTEFWNVYPNNKAYFLRLLEFCKEILAICGGLGIVPVLNGSLAVFAYARGPSIKVNDIDLACSELEFPSLRRALDAKGIAHVTKEWHVLQVRRDNLKVEFDSIEYWMAGLPTDFITWTIEGCEFNLVGLDSLKELYRRGLEATTGTPDDIGRLKFANTAKKYK